MIQSRDILKQRLTNASKLQCTRYFAFDIELVGRNALPHKYEQHALGAFGVLDQNDRPIEFIASTGRFDPQAWVCLDFALLEIFHGA